MLVHSRSLLIFLLIFVGAFGAAAQDRKPVRMEIPVKDDSEIYKVVPCGENGCAIIFLSDDDAPSGQMSWVSSMLNKDLSEAYRHKFTLPKGFVLEEALYNNNRLLGFFYTTRNSADTNFYLIDVNLIDSTLTQYFYPVPGRAGISHFAMTDEYAIAGINTRDDQSMILRYSLLDKKISLISAGVSGKSIVEYAGINKITGGFSAILRTNQSMKRRDYYLVKFNKSGIPYFTHQFDKFDNKLINTAYLHEIDEQSDIIIGSYGTSSRTRMFLGNETVGVTSSGFFSIVIDSKGNEKVKTYEFTEFDKFYRYLRRPTEIAPRRSLLRRDRSLNESSSDHNLLSHEIFKFNGEYIFIAEAYYPEYRIMTSMVYDYYGRPYPSTYSIFDGFRYLTTFIAGFDENGELKWNNDLELTDALTQNLRERVTPFTESNNLMLCYVDGDRIAYKIIDKGENLSNISYAKIDPLRRHDKVLKESNSYILPWYSDYFLVHGYQSIRNSYSSEKAKPIFYISKMAFRE